jgi:hypothetical protein
VLLGQDKFQIALQQARKLEAVEKWNRNHHTAPNVPNGNVATVYDGNNLKLYLNGFSGNPSSVRRECCLMHHY